jgi:nitroimidazol reductase NimA-like FMN-containing flavoprotein (pyridoxamine 5'-phosphate oxidase superfamily)
MVPDHARPLLEPEGVEVDRNGLEVLDPAECARLLGTTTFGRIGITVSALPTILPINYRLVGDRIVFRTAPGTKLDAATRGSVVAFEVDSVDPLDHSGWSVVVTGVASQVTDPDDLVRLEDAQIPRWAPSPADRVVELPLHMVSGRRLAPGALRPVRR